MRREGLDIKIASEVFFPSSVLAPIINSPAGIRTITFVDSISSFGGVGAEEGWGEWLSSRWQPAAKKYSIIKRGTEVYLNMKLIILSYRISVKMLCLISVLIGIGCAAVNPTIKYLDPTEGPQYGGNILFIMGHGIEDGALVYIGDKLIEDVRVNNFGEAIIDEMPSMKPGVYDVTLINQDGTQCTFPQAYTCLDTPIIYEIKPSSGVVTGGTKVTIKGDYFKPGAMVKIGDNMSREVIVYNAQVITAITAASSTGDVDVIVFNRDGLSYNLAGGFKFIRVP